MLVIHDAGVAAALPKLAGLVPLGVNPTRVFGVRFLERAGHGLFRGRLADDVVVVRHQAVSQDAEAVLPAVLLQYLQKDAAIQISEEDIFTVLSLLHHAWEHQAQRCEDDVP